MAAISADAAWAAITTLDSSELEKEVGLRRRCTVLGFNRVSQEVDYRQSLRLPGAAGAPIPTWCTRFAVSVLIERLAIGPVRPCLAR
jgi:hypothetical protein